MKETILFVSIWGIGVLLCWYNAYHIYDSNDWKSRHIDWVIGGVSWPLIVGFVAIVGCIFLPFIGVIWLVECLGKRKEQG